MGLCGDDGVRPWAPVRCVRDWPTHQAFATTASPAFPVRSGGPGRRWRRRRGVMGRPSCKPTRPTTMVDRGASPNAMGLGGRLADLVGRRRSLVWGTLVFFASSISGSAAQNPGTVVGSWLASTAMPSAVTIMKVVYVSAAGESRPTAPSTQARRHRSEFAHRAGCGRPRSSGFVPSLRAERRHHRLTAAGVDPDSWTRSCHASVA